MLNNTLIQKLTLAKLNNFGPVLTKRLISHCGSIENTFAASYDTILKTEGIGIIKAKQVFKQLKDKSIFREAEKEVEFILKNNIKPVFYTDSDYPQRLKNYEDAPILLFYKGNVFVNKEKVIGIVGTRMLTEYGKSIIDELLIGVAPYNPLIVSGLAYGVDAYAHKAAIKNNLQTTGVMGTGLDNVYPSQNRNLAKQMISNGGLISEFFQHTNPDRENFPKRNRIVAGMCDVIIVVESDIKGGSLITADLANGYQKDVMAFPGEIGKKQSKGCNWLIKTNRANLIENSTDFIELMGWEKKKPTQQQSTLALDLPKNEELIYNYILQHKKIEFEKACYDLKQTSSQLSSILFTMEMKGIVKTLPGKTYSLY